MNPVSHEDYRALARRRLPPVLFDYIDGGSYGGVTARLNETALEQVRLRQRVMRDMSNVDLSTSLFGQSLSLPVVLGPVGLAGMYARRGEVQAARAAHAAGIPFSLSTVSVCSIDEVVRASPSPPWFQLYVVKDRQVVRDLLAGAWEAGCRTLILTVDLPTPGARYRDLRSGMMNRLGFAGQVKQAWEGLSHPVWLWDVFVRGRPHQFGNLASAMPRARQFADYWAWIAGNFDPTVTWRDLEVIRAEWPGSIVVKGVMEVEDARQAVAAGADGVVVSNHGGRQLDGVEASITALPRVAQAVGAETVVLFDGGVRTGLEVLKALALGARACLLGRAWAFPLAAGGQQGLANRLEGIRAELRTAMVLTGCSSARDAGPHLVRQASDAAH